MMSSTQGYLIRNKDCSVLMLLIDFNYHFCECMLMNCDMSLLHVDEIANKSSLLVY